MPRVRARAVLRALGAVLVAVAVVVAVALARGPERTVAAAPATAGEKDTKRFSDGSCKSTAVRFGVVQDPDDTTGRAAAERLARDLAEGLGCRAIVVVYPSQAQLVTALALHDVEIGQLDPAAVVVAVRTVGASPIAAYAVDEDSPARTAPVALWARRDGDVRRLADLRDRRVAFGPRLTVGGDIDPRTALRTAGVRPAADSPFVSTDAAALAALRAGRVDAAVTRGPVDARDARRLRRVWGAGGPLADVLVLRPGIPSAVRRLVLFAVRGLPTAALAPLAARQSITEPAPLATVPLDVYAPVAARLDALTAAGEQP